MTRGGRRTHLVLTIVCGGLAALAFAFAVMQKFGGGS